MKLPLEFNSKWDSTLRVEVLENRPASIGFTENGDNIVLNLWRGKKSKCKLCELCCGNQCHIDR